MAYLCRDSFREALYQPTNKRTLTAQNGQVRGEIPPKRAKAGSDASGLFCTDEQDSYKGLDAALRHESVKQSAGEYVNGMAHTNSFESFWAMLKRGYMGNYHKMSVKNFARYVTEFAGRHNVRDLNTLAQMVALVRDLEDRRLRHTDLGNYHG